MEFDEILTRLNEIKSGLTDGFSSGKLDMDAIISKLDSLPAILNDIKEKSFRPELTKEKSRGITKGSESSIRLPLLAVEDYR